MKYNFTICQKAIIDHNINLDLYDLVIYDVMRTFSTCTSCKRKHEDGVIWYWISYKFILNQIPLLRKYSKKEGKYICWKKDAVYRRVLNLINEEFIIPHKDNKKSGSTYFTFGERGDLYFTSSKFIYDDDEYTVPEPDPLRFHNQNPSVPEPYNNNIDYNINKLIIDIVEYFNERCHTHYRPTTAKTRKDIKARIREFPDLTLDDFKEVIDKKAAEWLGTAQEKYLRPITIFSNKFEAYLNQPWPKKVARGGAANHDEKPIMPKYKDL